MNYPRRTLLLIWLLLLSVYTAGEEDKEPPSLALLEFLGKWETEEGEWIDPVVVLGDDSFEQLTGVDVRNEDD